MVRHGAKKQQCGFAARDLGVMPAAAVPVGRRYGHAKLPRAALQCGAQGLQGGWVEAHRQAMPSAVLPCIIECLLIERAGWFGLWCCAGECIWQLVEQGPDRDQQGGLLCRRLPVSGRTQARHREFDGPRDRCGQASATQLPIFACGTELQLQRGTLAPRL
ncbi:hypothetical protein D3C79_640600 [compost metagenome]